MYYSDRTIITVRPPEVVQLDLEEHHLTLPCISTTDYATNLTVTWYKGDNPLRSLGDKRLVHDVSDDLFIDLSGLSVEEKDRYHDDYTCVASNGYSVDKAVTSVTIDGTPMAGEIFSTELSDLII